MTSLAPTQEQALTAGEQLMQQGRAEERKDNLRTLLTAKYGAIGDLFDRRIDAAPPEQIAAWMLRFVHAPTLADIFKD